MGATRSEGGMVQSSRGMAHERRVALVLVYLCVCACILYTKEERKATTKGKEEKEGVCQTNASTSLVRLELIQEEKERADLRRS